MMEWAVFLAIFLPAAEVVEGCFRLGELDEVLAADVEAPVVV